MRAVHFCAVCGILWIGGGNSGERRLPDMRIKFRVTAKIRLEQIVAVGKNQLALATHPEEKTCQFLRLALVCPWRFPYRSTKC